MDVLSIREQYLYDHPDVVKKVMRAWFTAIDYWKHHQEEANAIMAKHYSVTPNEFAEMISGLYWPTHEQNITFFDEPGKGKYWSVADTFGDIFSSTGQIKSKPDMVQATNTRLLQTLYDNTSPKSIH